MKAIKIYNNHSNVENKLPLSKMNLALCKDDRHLYYGELPYSYKLEYLESTGTQYINLNYYARGTDIVEVRVKSTTNNWNWYAGTGSNVTNYLLWNPFFGMQDSGNYKFWGTYVGNKDGSAVTTYFYNQSAGTNSYPGFTPTISKTQVLNWYTYKFNQKTLYRDGSKMTGTNGGTVDDTILNKHTIYLFASNEPAVQHKGTSKLQIAWFKISDKNQNPILDMIPVRVGNIGYMYDKLSGQLYGNSGSGNFVCGPDIE